MEKIKTKEDRKKKEKRNKLIIGVLLVIVMFFSTLGFAFYRQAGNSGNGEDKIEYRGLEFISSNQRWFFNIDGEEFVTANNPKEIGDVKVEINKTLSDYVGRPLYFSEESPGEDILEIRTNLNRYYLRSQRACLGENCSGNLPKKDCSSNVIIIEDTNKSEVWQEENCIHIDSNNLKGTDAFVYRLMGITRPKK